MRVAGVYRMSSAVSARPKHPLATSCVTWFGASHACSDVANADGRQRSKPTGVSGKSSDHWCLSQGFQAPVVPRYRTRRGLAAGRRATAAVSVQHRARRARSAVEPCEKTQARSAVGSLGSAGAIFVVVVVIVVGSDGDGDDKGGGGGDREERGGATVVRRRTFFSISLRGQRASERAPTRVFEQMAPDLPWRPTCLGEKKKHLDEIMAARGLGSSASD